MTRNWKLGLAVTGMLSLAACASNTSSTAQPSTAQQALIPPLMLPYGGGWAGGTARGNGSQVPAEDFLPADYLNGPEHIQAALDRGIPPEKVRMYMQVRGPGHFTPPASGIGPITDDPQRPYLNNSMMRAMGTQPTQRFADLNDAAAKNLKPWALEALKKQNELVAAGKNALSRQMRCWELGVPGFHEPPQPLYFIQTPEEVVMYMGHRVRHIYMNVPHSKDLQPSWYGESVGRYEGDTLVVDTIGQNDKTFVDGYRTPHTTQIRVVERFRVINGGKGLDTSFTVEDPGAFNQPWSGRKPRYVVIDRALNDTDRICAAGNEDIYNLGLDPLQKATTPDF